MSRYLVFDVESIGLHGEGFDVGCVILDEGVEVYSSRWCCDPRLARGTKDGHDWVTQHVQPPEYGYNCSSPQQVRENFWQLWMSETRKVTALAADCPWPVEARFLIQCIEDDHAKREWDGPYPILDIMSVRIAAGLKTDCERLPQELPEHDPLADARQSARLLMEAISEINK